MSALKTIGIIGLGQMGRKMASKCLEDKRSLRLYDVSAQALQQSLALAKSGGYESLVSASSSLKDMKSCDAIVSILPNDKIVQQTARELLDVYKSIQSPSRLVHVSCSTVSPVTSRELEKLYESESATFVAAPVFARPDGLAKRQATWMISGKSTVGKSIGTEILSTMGNVVDFGEDAGAANVVKLCGNFLIASSIESIGEAMALSEKHGVDRKKVMDLLSSTIFDCLIYKGYGQRVADRDHRPGGFSLSLGLKDVTLVNQAAREADVPMPVLSLLLDRYTSAKAKGLADFDWSAIGLNIAEDAGIDISQDKSRNRKDIDEGRTY